MRNMDRNWRLEPLSLSEQIYKNPETHGFVCLPSVRSVRLSILDYAPGPTRGCCQCCDEICNGTLDLNVYFYICDIAESINNHSHHNDNKTCKNKSNNDSNHNNESTHARTYIHTYIYIYIYYTHISIYLYLQYIFI